jgi:hypothetical protein
MLPRLDRFMAGGEFDPADEEITFRIAATDHTPSVLAPLLAKSVLSKPTKVHESVFVLPKGGKQHVRDAGRLGRTAEQVRPSLDPELGSPQGSLLV